MSDEKDIYLHGVAAQFYRGIGEETQYIGPFSKMNIFIGPNNAGKSVVLDLVHDWVRKVSTNSRDLAPDERLSSVEEHRGPKSGKFELAVAETPARLQKTILSNLQRKSSKERVELFQHTLKMAIELFTLHGMVWRYRDGFDLGEEDIVFLKTRPIDWQSLWTFLTGYTGGSLEEHWIPSTYAYICNSVSVPKNKTHAIPAKRELGPKGEAFKDNSGKGLIDHLASLQNPNWDKREDHQRFLRINDFLREVTGKEDAKLEVPSDREHLLVHIDDKVLPLQSLGTGIHEVVLIASFCTIHDGSIICLEEPEIHLHPLLQRKLINYLRENTSSQYFIATHSSAFINTEGAAVFRVRNDGKQTYVNKVESGKDQRAVLEDLGVRASDLLQANAVIWVEGPTDRMYLNWWLAEVDPELKEGIHYSIMFYGGANLAHLSGNDDETGGLIELRKLNQHMAVVMDSDRAEAEAALKPHVQRMMAELQETGGVGWVTAGREIENYLDVELVEQALEAAHPGVFDQMNGVSENDNILNFKRKDGERQTKPNKVKVARFICETETPNLDRLDLRARLTELVAMIRKANEV